MCSLLCLLRMKIRPVNDEDNEDFIEIELFEIIGMTKMNFTNKEIRRMTFKRFMKLYDVYKRINGLTNDGNNGNTVDENGFQEINAVYC